MLKLRLDMSATEWAAWVGACSGVGGVLWNIYTKLTPGPKLLVTALGGIVMRPALPNDPRFLRITAQNIGTALTTITNVTFHVYDSWWARFRNRASYNAMLNQYQGPQLPHRIEVGAEWSALMTQDERFEDLLRNRPELRGK
jgi:hypothetical protein